MATTKEIIEEVRGAHGRGAERVTAETSHPVSVERFRSALKQHGATGDVVRLDDNAHTAQAAADGLGITRAQIANSLVFLADGEPVLVMSSGGHRVDTNKISAAFGGKKITKANADDVRAATGYVIGGVSPVGLATALPTLVDTHLAQFETIFSAGGHPAYVYETTFAELVRMTGGTPTELAEAS
jgi:Cys-tRNA(Pro) deacylase